MGEDRERGKAGAKGERERESLRSHPVSVWF